MHLASTEDARRSRCTAPDLVRRRWRVAAPNRLVVADFTYVPMAAGFGYTAFVIEAYAGLITGWECSLRKDTEFVERALRNAAAFRARAKATRSTTRSITRMPDRNIPQYISPRH
jgi:putative transposase